MKSQKNKNKKSKRGGKREGAGRETLYGTPMVRKTIRIPQYQLDYALQKGTLSSVVRELIENDISKEGK